MTKRPISAVIERTTPCLDCGHISATHGMSGKCMQPDCECRGFVVCPLCGGNRFTIFNYGHTVNPDGSLGGRGVRSVPCECSITGGYDDQ